MQLHGNSKINQNGQLEIAGITSMDLVDQYSSPLFVYDEDLVTNQCRRFHSVLEGSGLDYHISLSLIHI